MPWWFDWTQGSATAMSHISTTETKTTTTTHSFIVYNTVDMNNDTFPSIDPSRSIFPPTEPPTLLNAEKTIDDDGSEDYLNDWCYGYFGTDSGKAIVPVIAAISILCCVVIISAITLPLFDKKERKKMSAYYSRSHDEYICLCESNNMPLHAGIRNQQTNWLTW